MRKELLTGLFRAYVGHNDEEFLRFANEIIREEEGRGKYMVAKELRAILSSSERLSATTRRLSKKTSLAAEIPKDTSKGFPLLEVKEYFVPLEDVILSEASAGRLQQIIQEYKHESVFQHFGLHPKRKVLFAGPPGTGKTFSARALSTALARPMVYVRFDAVTSSLLGETATNLRKIFDFIEEGRWVVLFDEFDIIGKDRDDPTEHGEIKRVVNNFIQMLDNYDGSSLLIAATNHPHLLDVGVWRRFDDIVPFFLPGRDERERLFQKYLRVLKTAPALQVARFADETDGFSAADVAQVCEEALRRALVEGEAYVTRDHLQRAVAYQRQRYQAVGREHGRPPT